MSTLLVQGCSKSKNRPEEAVPAFHLYDGFFFKIIKKAIRESEFDNSIDMCILSAKYGLIDADTEITWYERRMDAERAESLAPEVKRDLHARVSDGYDTVIINVGSGYRPALEGIGGSLDADVHYIGGEGIGMKGHHLKRFVRGDIEAVTERSSTAVSEH